MPGESLRRPEGDEAPGSGRLAEVIRRLHEARTRPPRSGEGRSDDPVIESSSPVLGARSGGAAVTGELLWKPFPLEGLERTRPVPGEPPTRDEFESHLSQFLGAHPKRSGTLFRAQAVSVSFGGITACRAIDLELNDGEIVAVVGPNGSGKTALCDAIGGYIPMSDGRVYFGERDVTALTVHERAALGMARTFARPALFESLTVVENLMTAGDRRMRGGFFSCGLRLALSRHDDRVARLHSFEVLELLGIEHLADVAVAALPAGARRLVEIGRAVAGDPKLAVLDEPAAGLDAKERGELAERIGMVCDELGVAVVVTDQDLPFVSSVADFVYVLESGAVAGKGEPGEIDRDPRVQATYLRPPLDEVDGEMWLPDEDEEL